MIFILILIFFCALFLVLGISIGQKPAGKVRIAFPHLEVEATSVPELMELLDALRDRKLK